MLKRVLGVVAALLVLPISMIVLSELGEVVVIRSVAGGETRETRIWVIDVDEGLLVRGSAGKAWVEDARRAARVELDRDGKTREYEVVERPGEAARDQVNQLMREKYGVADRAIGLLRDYSEAVPLLLVPASG